MMAASDPWAQAAATIDQSEALLLTAGAGMGVDSGLPDFRGNEGFWNAYPPFRERGLSFYDLANPIWFERNPAQAWGFYGHRFHLYQKTQPHAGFGQLLAWTKKRPQGHFVFTSNVDGHFQAAGFDPDRILECHGSFTHLQCAARCTGRIWPAADLQVNIDQEKFLAQPPLPSCTECGGIARPNILMFGDFGWLESHFEAQHQRYQKWLSSLPRGCRLAVIEIGAGTAVPTVRYESQRRVSGMEGATLIRINPREFEGPVRTISLAAGGLEAIKRLASLAE